MVFQSRFVYVDYVTCGSLSSFVFRRDVEQHLQETGGNFKRVSENEDGNEVYELTAEDLAGGPIPTK